MSRKLQRRALSGEQQVVAVAAPEAIVSESPDQQVVSGPTEPFVVAGAAEDLVDAVAAEDQVAAVAAVDVVAEGIRRHLTGGKRLESSRGIVAHCLAGDQVVAVAQIDRIGGPVDCFSFPMIALVDRVGGGVKDRQGIKGIVGTAEPRDQNMGNIAGGEGCQVDGIDSVASVLLGMRELNRRFIDVECPGLLSSDRRASEVVTQDDVTEMPAESLSQWILDELGRTGRLRRSQITARTGRSSSTVRRTLAELRDEGRIVFEGSARSGYWRIA